MYSTITSESVLVIMPYKGNCTVSVLEPGICIIISPQLSSIKKINIVEPVGSSVSTTFIGPGTLFVQNLIVGKYSLTIK